MAYKNVVRWRAYVALSGAVVLALWWILSGGPGHVIKIDYQWIGPLADSALIVIDDSVVGVLEFVPNRRAERGFKVERGEHIVELRARNCDAQPETILVDRSRLNIIIADLSDNGMACQVFFR